MRGLGQTSGQEDDVLPVRGPVGIDRVVVGVAREDDFGLVDGQCVACGDDEDEPAGTVMRASRSRLGVSLNVLP